jgi:hypothetical protein
MSFADIGRRGPGTWLGDYLVSGRGWQGTPNAYTASATRPNAVLLKPLLRACRNGGEAEGTHEAVELLSAIHVRQAPFVD